MVKVKLLPLLAAAVFMLSLPKALHADNITTAELELFDVVQRSGDGTWYHYGAGSASIKIDQTGNRNVRSQLELSAAILPTEEGVPDSLHTINRAYGKFRFDSYRGVIGKAPFSWGEGLIFNVADEIFSPGTSANLMQQEFKDPSAWITSFSKYFGPFSFVEVLVNPGTLEISQENQDNSLLSAGATAGTKAPRMEDSRVGGRFVSKAGGIKFEGGYLFDGQNGQKGSDWDYSHRLFLNLQGNLWLDWHLSTSLEIPDPKHAGDNPGEILWRGQLYTAGIYSMIPVAYNDTLSFRVETRLYPAGSWSQDHSDNSPRYGIYSYGEISYDFGDGLSLLTRSLVNPIDLSARISPGFSWNIFQGFTLLGFATVHTGEAGDTYPWETENSGESTLAGASGLALQIGSSITY